MLPEKGGQVLSRGSQPKGRRMKRLLKCVLLVSLCLCAAMPESQSEMHLEQLRAAIQQQRLNWVAGETSVSGLSLEEKRRLCGFRPDMERVPAASALLQAPLGAFPSVLDWRDNPAGFNWTTPVRNQGGCGSCVAFAVVGALEACENINVFGAPRPDYDLSEQFLFSCGGRVCKGPEAGWYFAGDGGALEFLKTDGVPDEACYPYRSSDGNDYPCQDRCDDWFDRVVTISDYTVISWYDPPLDAVLKNYLQTQPVACAMDVYFSFYSYNAGVYEHVGGDEPVGSHAVLIVGWDDTTSPPCWICKNSWGTGWGEGGYFRIRRRDSNIGSYAVFIDYDNTPPPLEISSLTSVGMAVLISGLITCVIVVCRTRPCRP